MLLSTPSLFGPTSLFGPDETPSFHPAPRQRRVDAARDEIRAEVRQAIRVLEHEEGVSRMEALPPDRLRVAADEGSHAREMLEDAAIGRRRVKLGDATFTVHRSIRENLVTWRLALEKARAAGKTIRIRPFDPDMIRQIRSEELHDLAYLLRRFGQRTIGNIDDLLAQINGELDGRSAAPVEDPRGLRFVVEDRPVRAARPRVQEAASLVAARSLADAVVPRASHPDIVAPPVADEPRSPGVLSRLKSWRHRQWTPSVSA